MVSIAGSEWSFAQFRLNSAQVGPDELKAVVYEDVLHIVTKRGWYLRVIISEAGGELKDYIKEPLLKI